MNIFQFSSLFCSHKVKDTIAPLLTRKSISYIPAYWQATPNSMGWNTRQYYELGFRSGLCCPIGENFNESVLKKALKCDAIHFGGGNTFELMAMIHLHGLTPYFKQYVEDGGILIGTSAGSIIMGQTIDIAQFADANYLGLDGEFLNGLGIVDWDVKPHFESWQFKKPMFQNFVNESRRNLYCLFENQAIHVNDKGIHFLGQVPLKLAPNR